jgi:hypothetical protein
MLLKKMVSAAVRQKNRNNSEKSTGPNTEKGKNRSRFNATKHGLTAEYLMFDTDGKPVDNALSELVEALRARYGADDIIAELLIDNIAVDYWRQNKGLEAEMFYFSRKDWAFYAQGSLPTIQRYNTTNRRALLRNLELLEKLKSMTKPSEADTVAGEYESEHTPSEGNQVLPNDEESNIVDIGSQCESADSSISLLPEDDETAVSTGEEPSRDDNKSAVAD